MIQWTANPNVHFAFEAVAYGAGALTYTVMRSRRGDTISDSSRSAIVASAAIGAALGAHLLAAAAVWQRGTTFTALLVGKTIVGGLLGGLISVEVSKRILGITRSTGDLLAVPIVVALSIGRIGCLLAGPLDGTAGIATTVPWAFAVGDNVRRHPVALYEIVFLLLLLPFIVSARREGGRFRRFLTSYLLFRFFVDFLKPQPPAVLIGLSVIQWACLAGLAYYAVTLVEQGKKPNAERDAAVPLL